MNVQDDQSAAPKAKRTKKATKAKTPKVPMTPERKALRQLLARSLWSVEMGKTSVARKEGTAEPFAKVRAVYTAKAGQLLRSLDGKGVIITAPAKALAEDAAEV